jgi:hypothetical protein
MVGVSTLRPKMGTYKYYRFYFNRFTTMGSGRKKNSHPVGYGRNNTKSTINHQHNPPTNITTMARLHVTVCVTVTIGSKITE